MNIPILAMLTAEIVSIVGSAIAAIAIPWLLLDAHIGPGKMSFVFAAESGAALFAGLLGTIFLDRVEKRQAHVVCDILLAAASLSLVAIYLSHTLSSGIVALILACSAVISAFSSAAGSAMIPELLSSAKADSQRINGLIGTFHNFGDLVGPIVGGLTVAAIGSAGALALDGTTFLISALLLGGFVPRFCFNSTRETDQPATGRSEYLAGVREIVRAPVLRMVTLVSAIINMVITPLLVLLLPYMVKQSGGNALEVGVLISSLGGGAFLTSLLFTVKKLQLSPLRSMLGSVTLGLLCFTLIPLSPGNFAYPLLFLIGASVGYLGPLEQTLMQNSPSLDQIGRVMLAYAAFRTFLVPIGYFLIGMTLAHASIAISFFSLATLLTLALIGLVYSLVSGESKCQRVKTYLNSV